MQNYEERIREIRSDLSPSFEVLANFLLDSYSSASFLTATELAYSLDLDPATVVRFAQKLGYAGYPELQREIQQRVKDELLIGLGVACVVIAEGRGGLGDESDEALGINRQRKFLEQYGDGIILGHGKTQIEGPVGVRAFG